jgi:DNA-directed RNA polymerase specialized sigma24 family protein
MAFNSYLMMLRSERRRRQREDRHAVLVPESSRDEDQDGGPDGDTVLELADVAPLTVRQRQYIKAVFDEHLGIEDIATRNGTTPRAVRAVLARAAACIRCHVLRSGA